LGLDALNAALACAEVTETTAAELQGPAPASEGASDASDTAAAERFLGAAVRASLAAASASNAAMSAAIAAVEGSRMCMQACGPQASPAAEEDEEEATGDPGGTKNENGEAAGADARESEEAEEPEKPQRKQPPSKEEQAAAAIRRLVSQRNNNHKVLKRLNSEILGHQQNVRQFLQANRQLIPEVSGEAKRKVMKLLEDYCQEARMDLQEALLAAQLTSNISEGILASLRNLPILVPFMEPQGLAIPVCVKARVLKMAALYDLTLTMQVLEANIFATVRSALSEVCGSSAGHASFVMRVDELSAKVRQELCSTVAEEGVDVLGGSPSAVASSGGQTPASS